MRFHTQFTFMLSSNNLKLTTITCYITLIMYRARPLNIPAALMNLPSNGSTLAYKLRATSQLSE